MDAGEVISLISLALTTLVAITVPYLAFQFAMRQEKVRWLREQRAQFYVDLLAEAYAEQQYLDYELADSETRERMARYFTDLRLPPAERARLGARGNVYGSSEVNRLFNRMQAIGFNALLPEAGRPEDPLTWKVRMAGALEDLQTAIQAELGTKIPLERTKDRPSEVRGPG